MRIYAKEKYRNAAGDIIPSVTTALAELAKPALVRWANKMGLQGIDTNKYVDALGDIGTLTHAFIISHLLDEILDVDEFTPEQVRLAQVSYKLYLDWEARNPVRCIIAEEPFVSEKYQFGGRPDLYAVCNKELVLADFKTNAIGIFPEMIYQVAAYWYLLIEAGYKVSKVVILRLGRGGNEGAEEKILSKYELDNGLDIFLRCLDIYNLKKGDSALCTSVN